MPSSSKYSSGSSIYLVGILILTIAFSFVFLSTSTFYKIFSPVCSSTTSIYYMHFLSMIPLGKGTSFILHMTYSSFALLKLISVGSFLDRMSTMLLWIVSINFEWNCSTAYVFSKSLRKKCPLSWIKLSFSCFSCSSFNLWISLMFTLKPSKS